MAERTDRFEDADADEEYQCDWCGIVSIHEGDIKECECCGTEYCNDCGETACPACGMDE